MTASHLLVAMLALVAFAGLALLIAWSRGYERRRRAIHPVWYVGPGGLHR